MKVPDLASSCSRSGFWAGCGHNGASSPCWGTSNGATFPLILFHPHSTRDSPVLPFRTLGIRSLIIFSAFPRGKQPAESGDFKNLMLFSFPLRFHFAGGVTYRTVALDGRVSAVPTRRLELRSWRTWHIGRHSVSPREPHVSTQMSFCRQRGV